MAEKSGAGRLLSYAARVVVFMVVALVAVNTVWMMVDSHYDTEEDVSVVGATVRQLQGEWWAEGGDALVLLSLDRGLGHVAWTTGVETQVCSARVTEASIGGDVRMEVACPSEKQFMEWTLSIDWEKRAASWRLWRWRRSHQARGAS